VFLHGSILKVQA